MKKLIIVILLQVLWQLTAVAHINPALHKGPSTNKTLTGGEVSFRESCDNAVAQIDQQINNVRARLTTGGDVWWDGNQGRYIVPKPPPGVPEVSSIYAGAVWIGGRDPGTNLKMAAQTYGRGSGNFDFYPGPIYAGDPNYPEGQINDPRRGTIGRDTCAQWDRFFVVKGENIDAHVKNWRKAAAEGMSFLDPAQISDDILGWPAFGNRFFEGVHQFRLPEAKQGLAGFWDQDRDGLYEPDEGDYPIIEIRRCNGEQPKSSPDEMIFWIYNDAGNDHQETGSALKIRMEVQVQAFSYKTNDDINSMTFQRYKLINRAVEQIDSTYFGVWVDPDLGCHTDDFVGCDVDRSLAYVYNADQLDGTTGCTCDGGGASYCDEVPILGVDYFEGPLNELGEELGMSSFTYYNNGSVGDHNPATTDPQTAEEYYNYLSGRWRDGTPFTEGGDGYMTGDPTKYAFPGAPNSTEWSMCTTPGIVQGDRRTIQASGPFTLLPGAVNELIIGLVWVADQVYPCPSIARLQKADDLAQSLFDHCFMLTRGPDAPDVDWVELDREIVAVFSNDTLNSNNAFELYQEPGLGIPEGEDSLYRFEGYKLYQFSGPNITLADVDDFEKVRLVYQVDKQNNLGRIFNWETLSAEDGEAPIGEPIFVPKRKVDGQNQGLRHTFQITEDQFAEGDRRLINHKKYYFAAVAYAHNEYQAFDADAGTGQDKPYLEGNRNIGDGQNSFYTVIPRKITDRNLHTMYGEGPIVTRIDGIGNGGNFLDVSAETRTEIERTIKENDPESFSGEITYKGGFSPIDVKIFNPLEVRDGEYELTFEDANMTNNELDVPVNWVLRSLTDPIAPVVTSEQSISELNEQVIREFGFSVSIAQVPDAGKTPLGTNGAVGYAEEYLSKNPSPWIAGIADDTRLVTGNPLLDGNMYNYLATDATELDYELDPNNRFKTMANSLFMPYYLTDFRDKESGTPYLTPGWLSTQGTNIVRGVDSLDDLNNVDIIMTANKDLWSRCVVIESANRYYENAGFFAEGERGMFDTRAHVSVSKNDNDGDGLPDADSPLITGEEQGFGWFPGYAIDVETGKRLNIFFGENSTYNGDYGQNFGGGNDMMWNPSSTIYEPLEVGGASIYNYVSGGQHYIYVTDEPYDRCEYINSRLNTPAQFLRKINALKTVTWAGFLTLPRAVQLKSYAEGLIPEDVVIKLRVDNPYKVEKGTGEFNGYPTYRFEVQGKQATSLNEEGIAEALQCINVVPNPYYGFSDYEDSQFESIVKITNLPAECVVTIYSLEGKFIRQYNRNETPAIPPSPNRAIEVDQITPDLEWDLKNFKQIPIASGVYLIHVAAPAYGERTLKWFGVNRQFDPSGL